MNLSAVVHPMSGARDRATIYGIVNDIWTPVTGTITDMTVIINALTTVEATNKELHCPCTHAHTQQWDKCDLFNNTLDSIVSKIREPGQSHHASSQESKATSPHITKAFLRSDGAGCYHSNNLIAFLEQSLSHTGIKVMRYVEWLQEYGGVEIKKEAINLFT